MIEIPGYNILRQLGRGGMATVYLATQESVQRKVALKVMAPSLNADPDFSERFLREARIAARLHHRHVVGIHDVTRSGEYNCIAMEYLSGGPVLTREGGPRSVAFALRITREIALALNYAHEQGFVHRDVKPDNILLRDDGSSALTDFGIARAADSVTHVTRAGGVVGTPHYMSPEQARGRSVDGRADLYSLGIVLYELVLGRVPYTADDSLAVGIMHITQPVPVLPASLLTLQPLLSRMLAKQPEDRYQTGQQVAEAIEQIELDLARNPLRLSDDAGTPNSRDTSKSFSAEDSHDRYLPINELPMMSASRVDERPIATPAATPRERADPSLGSLDDIATTDTHRRVGSRDVRRATKKSASRWPLGTLALLVVLAVVAFGAWQYRDRLRALMPNTELNNLIAQGQQALADGKLIGTQGDSARELFARARAIDADNDVARDGLNQVGTKLIDTAQAALQNNDLATARNDIAAAEDILGGGDRIETVKKALQAADAKSTQIEDALARADAALAAGRLLGDNSASVLYQRVLAADPGNALATNGLDKVAKAQALFAREAIAQNNVDQAASRINDLTRLAPNYPAVPELRAKLTELRDGIARAQAQQQVQTSPPQAPPQQSPTSPAAQPANPPRGQEALLTRAQNVLRANQLGGADGAQALFAAALKREPHNARARAGLRDVGIAYAAQASTQLDANNLDGAQAALREAQALAGDAPEVRSARARLRELRESAMIAEEQTREPSLADRARLEEILGNADRALNAGNLMDPGGAYDQYRDALHIDPNNAHAMNGMKRIAPRARALFDQALTAGQPNSARGYLDAISETDPGNAGALGMRERLAGYYFDQAEARIGQGRRNDALRALNSARELSPTNPRSASLEARLQSIPTTGG